MNGERSAGVGPGTDPGLAYASEEAEHATEEQAERWARALVPYLIPQAQPLPTPGGWRASDGALTPPKTAAPSASTEPSLGQGDAPDAQNRVIMSVKTADLGSLSLVLERGSEGVRVVIGVADPASIGQLASERDALARQLLGSGLRVDSIQVVAQRDVGTVLAPPRLVARLRASADRGEAQDEADKARRRGSRKLNLVG